jgi:hypothetical protein
MSRAQAREHLREVTTLRHNAIIPTRRVNLDPRKKDHQQAAFLGLVVKSDII